MDLQIVMSKLKQLAVMKLR